jgi:hypothetical protein
VALERLQACVGNGPSVGFGWKAQTEARMKAGVTIGLSFVGAWCALAALHWAPAEEPSAPRNHVTALLWDGSLIKGSLEMRQVEVQTVYGQFNIPIADVNAIRLAVRADASERAQIDQLILALGDTDFKAREAAQAELKKKGWLARPQLEKALKAGDPEIVSRVKELLAEMEKREDAPPRDDEVDTKAFLIRGTVTATTFTLATENGTLRIARKNLVSLSRSSAEADDGAERFSVPNIEGDWGAGCKVLQNKASLTFIYLSNERTVARFKDPTTIIYVSGAGSINFPATVSPDARRISFNNGAAWQR